MNNRERENDVKGLTEDNVSPLTKDSATPAAKNLEFDLDNLSKSRFEAILAARIKDRDTIHGIPVNPELDAKIIKFLLLSIHRYDYADNYDLASMSTDKLKPNIIEFKCENDVFKYRFIGLDDEEKSGFIRWNAGAFPNNFPHNDVEILADKLKLLPTIFNALLFPTLSEIVSGKSHTPYDTMIFNGTYSNIIFLPIATIKKVLYLQDTPEQLNQIKKHLYELSTEEPILSKNKLKIFDACFEEKLNDDRIANQNFSNFKIALKKAAKNPNKKELQNNVFQLFIGKLSLNTIIKDNDNKYISVFEFILNEKPDLITQILLHYIENQLLFKFFIDSKDKEGTKNLIIAYILTQNNADDLMTICDQFSNDFLNDIEFEENNKRLNYEYYKIRDCEYIFQAFHLRILKLKYLINKSDASKKAPVSSIANRKKNTAKNAAANTQTLDSALSILDNPKEIIQLGKLFIKNQEELQCTELGTDWIKDCVRKRLKEISLQVSYDKKIEDTRTDMTDTEIHKQNKESEENEENNTDQSLLISSNDSTNAATEQKTEAVPSMKMKKKKKKKALLLPSKSDTTIKGTENNNNQLNLSTNLDNWRNLIKSAFCYADKLLVHYDDHTKSFIINISQLLAAAKKEEELYLTLKEKSIAVTFDTALLTSMISFLNDFLTTNGLVLDGANSFKLNENLIIKVNDVACPKNENYAVISDEVKQHINKVKEQSKSTTKKRDTKAEKPTKNEPKRSIKKNKSSETHTEEKKSAHKEKEIDVNNKAPEVKPTEIDKQDPVKTAEDLFSDLPPLIDKEEPQKSSNVKSAPKPPSKLKVNASIFVSKNLNASARIFVSKNAGTSSSSGTKSNLSVTTPSESTPSKLSSNLNADAPVFPPKLPRPPESESTSPVFSEEKVIYLSVRENEDIQNKNIQFQGKNYKVIPIEPVEKDPIKEEPEPFLVKKHVTLFKARIERDEELGNYDLVLMSNNKLQKNIIQFKCEEQGLRYRVIGPDKKINGVIIPGKEETDVIPWVKLGGYFPKMDDEKILANKEKLLPTILEFTSNITGHRNTQRKKKTFEDWHRINEINHENLRKKLVFTVPHYKAGPTTLPPDQVNNNKIWSASNESPHFNEDEMFPELRNQNENKL